MTVRVLGIDPGSAVTGYGVIEGRGSDCRLIECGIIRSPRRGDLAVRLLHIYSDIQAVIERLEPDCMAVEGVFYRENPRTAVVLAHARGVALLAGAERGLQVAEYPPAEIKKAVVGTGRATKTQVGYMVQKLLGLAEPPRPSDASDGCAAALCHLLIGTGPLARGVRP
ncbi:MAG: crossover junction endodeoxyribonuclease RuvC [Candidatus Palauibacterales bacterium]|nr:crossover junction endodeoxyribonuclease RuvC [Candidatus Palauibacterales bacterium]MDP2483939.1 crossover junction endodeoxyribonuclease RuvC [Candidatus Palauibacterales bacterium]